MKVRDWMTHKPATVLPDDTLETARQKMDTGGFRRLPVVDGAGGLVGILSERDLRPHTGYLESTKVNAAMTETPITITPDAPIEYATQVMIDRKIGALPVTTQNGELVGIITETDLLQGFLHGLGGSAPSSRRIDFAFTKPGQSFAEAAHILEAAGATILGLGTLRPDDDAPDARTFFLRVIAADAERLADALRSHGYEVRGIHTA